MISILTTRSLTTRYISMSASKTFSPSKYRVVTRGIAERYAEGVVAVQLKLGFRPEVFEGDHYECLAWFKRPKASPNFPDRPHVADELDAGRSPFQADYRGVEKAVLVVVGEPVEDRQDVAAGVVAFRSLVRLNCCDERGDVSGTDRIMGPAFLSQSAR